MPEDLLWFCLPDIDANVCVQQKPGFHLESLPLLRAVIPPLGDICIVGHACEKIECPYHIPFFFAKYDLVATTEDFNFLALEPELLRQADRLAVP
jgi:hypothetical protein